MLGFAASGADENTTAIFNFGYSLGRINDFTTYLSVYQLGLKMPITTRDQINNNLSSD
jgi:hypothetical protein